jgi:hypothetical protein
VPLAKHDDIVQAFLPDRADQPIRGRGQPFWVCGRDTSLSYPRPWAEPAVAAGPPAEPIQPQLAGSLLFASAPGAFIFTIMEHALARRPWRSTEPRWAAVKWVGGFAVEQEASVGAKRDISPDIRGAWLWQKAWTSK